MTTCARPKRGSVILLEYNTVLVLFFLSSFAHSGLMAIVRDCARALTRLEYTYSKASAYAERKRRHAHAERQYMWYNDFE